MVDDGPQIIEVWWVLDQKSAIYLPLAPQNGPNTGELTTLAIRWVKMGVDRAETWSYGPK